MDNTTPPNAPLGTLRDGRLKATVWQNDSETGPYHTVTLAKIYEDSAGNWQESNSFSAGDLLRVAELARRAYNKVADIRQEQKRDDPKPEKSRSRAPRTRRAETQRAPGFDR